MSGCIYVCVTSERIIFTELPKNDLSLILGLWSGTGYFFIRLIEGLNAAIMVRKGTSVLRSLCKEKRILSGPR